MEQFDAEDIIASYSVGQDPFAALPPATLILMRQGLVPKSLMERVCGRRGLTLVGIEERHFDDGMRDVYLVRTPDV